MHALKALAYTLCIVLLAVRRGSLSLSGAVSALAVGTITLSTCNAVFPVVLLTFFVVGSIATKVGSRKKKVIEDGYEHSSRRTAVQVWANGLEGTLAAALHLYTFGTSGLDPNSSISYPTESTSGHLAHSWNMQHRAPFPVVTSPLGAVSTLTLVAFLAHYSCCLGDTLSSELGVLSRGEPRLVLFPFRKVPPGTNGGVSSAGLVAAAIGGIIVFAAAETTLELFTEVPIAEEHISFVRLFLLVLTVGSAVGGSLVDSLLGALVQMSVLDTETGKIVATGDVAGLLERQEGPNHSLGSEKDEDSEEVAGKRRSKRIRNKAKPRYLWVSGVDVLDNHGVNVVSAALATLLALAVASAYL